MSGCSVSAHIGTKLQSTVSWCLSQSKKEKDESLTKRSYTACDISAAFSLRPKPSFPPEIHAQTHEHRQTQSLPYVRGPARSPVSPLQAQWGPGIQQSLIRGGAGSCGRLLHPAWPCSQLRGLHGGLASGSFHQPSLPRGTGSLPSSENLGPQDVVVCCGGSAKERVRLCEHLISGAEGRGLRGSSGLAPALWSSLCGPGPTPPPFPPPMSSCTGQPSQQEREK